jgi:phage terminase small subunit
MLNPTDEKFLAATLRGATPEEAAIAAGLSEKTARVAGARLRKKPAIVEALAAIGISTPGAPVAVVAPAPSPPNADEGPELDDLPSTTDSLEFLEAIQANPRIPLSRRMEAAKTLLPFQHAKIGEKGKKETKADGAKQVAAGVDAYATRKPPKLTAVSN